MALEDFTTYIEEDETGNDIAITSSRCTITSMRRDATSWVMKSFGAGHFGNFEHLITFRWDESSWGAANCGFWAVSDGTNNTEQDMNDANVGIKCHVYEAGGYARIYISDYESEDSSYYLGTWDTIYYCTVKRAGTVGTLKIYSDAERTNLLETLTITTTETTYEYVYAVSSRDHATDAHIAYLYIENLDLQEALNPYPVGWLKKNLPTGYNCFLNQYLMAKSMGYDPLKLPDGTVW